jgi:uncharacterized protein YrrD
MLDNQTLGNQAYDDKNYLRVVDGMTVYTRSGDKVGTVRNYSPQSGYIDVHKGWLFSKDFYVPVSQIDTIAEDGITLDLEKDDLAGDNYNYPPMATAATTEPTTLADGSVIGTAKQPVETDGDVMFQPKAGNLESASGTDEADLLRSEQPYRVR